METIEELLEEVIAEAKALGIPISENISKEVKINSRAKKRFGCCKIITTNGVEHFEIELSQQVANASEKVIKQTLAHELLHTCRGCANHGKVWSYYAKVMNSVYEYNIKRADTPASLGIVETQEERAVNYLVMCEKCGVVIPRAIKSKLIKYPYKYRCKCGGRFKRVK